MNLKMLDLKKMEKQIIKVEKKIKKQVKKNIDKIFYLGGILSPLMTLPQLIKIFHFQDASGVSLFTWASFFCGAFFLLIYGIVHKQKPIIFMNATTLPVYLCIIIGIVIYK